MVLRSPAGSPRRDLPAWGRVLLTALGVAALAGAGQLGVAYGLSIVQLARQFDAAAPDEWHAQLAWIAWFAMVAALAGGYSANRLAIRLRLPSGAGFRAGIAAAAGLGAGAVAPLTMLPARGAQLFATIDPVLVTGLTATLGAAVGVLLTIAALARWAVRWNLTAVIAAAWLTALISAGPSLGPTDPLPRIRLGVLDAATIAPGTTQRLAIIGIPAIGLVAGVATGALARLRGYSTLTVALSGLAGPGLLALAYVIAGPGYGGEKTQAAPYWGALIGVAAGALGSVVAAVLRRTGTADGSMAASPAGARRDAFTRADPVAGADGPRGADPFEGADPFAGRHGDRDDPNRRDTDPFGMDRPGTPRRDDGGTSGGVHGRDSRETADVRGGSADPLSPDWSGLNSSPRSADRRGGADRRDAAPGAPADAGSDRAADNWAGSNRAEPSGRAGTDRMGGETGRSDRTDMFAAATPRGAADDAGDDWSGLTDTFAAVPRGADVPPQPGAGPGASGGPGEEMAEDEFGSGPFGRAARRRTARVRQAALAARNDETVPTTGSGTDQPGGQRPGTDQRGTDRPGGQRPGTDQRGGDRPGTDQRGGDRPGTDRPGSERPGSDRPGAERPPLEWPPPAQPGPGHASPVQAASPPQAAPAPGGGDRAQPWDRDEPTWAAPAQRRGAQDGATDAARPIGGDDRNAGRPSEQPAADWPPRPDRDRQARSHGDARPPAEAAYDPRAWEPPGSAAEPVESAGGRSKRRWGRNTAPKQPRQAPAPGADPKVPARDEEYVDWVSGLGGSRPSDQ